MLGQRVDYPSAGRPCRQHAKRWGCGFFLPVCKQTSVWTGGGSVAHLQLDHAAASGYEIHAGRSIGLLSKRPLLQPGTAARRTVCAECDGQESHGTYLHGLFESTGRQAGTAELGGSAQAQRLDTLRCARGIIEAAWRTKRGKPLDTALLLCNCCGVSAIALIDSGWCAVRGKTGWPSNLPWPACGLAVNLYRLQSGAGPVKMSTRYSGSTSAAGQAQCGLIGRAAGFAACCAGSGAGRCLLVDLPGTLWADQPAAV